VLRLQPTPTCRNVASSTVSRPHWQAAYRSASSARNYAPPSPSRAPLWIASVNLSTRDTSVRSAKEQLQTYLEEEAHQHGPQAVDFLEKAVGIA
jgi:hypothetical protein